MTISHTLQAAVDTAISFLSLCDKKRESLETVWRRVSTRSFCVYVEAAAPPVEQLGEDKEALLIFLGGSSHCFTSFFPKSSTSLPSGFPVVRCRGGLCSSLCTRGGQRATTTALSAATVSLWLCV